MLEGSGREKSETYRFSTSQRKAAQASIRRWWFGWRASAAVAVDILRT